jgi:bacteriocin biosynthesis cyclodehydratase domain-containing protein
MTALALAPVDAGRSPLSLPRRPRLTLDGPPVWRRPGELQLGWEPPLVVLRGVPKAMADAVALLDGCHSRHDVALAVGAPWARWLLEELDRHGVLAEGPAARFKIRVGLSGTGRLALAIAERLAAHGFKLDGRRADVVVVAPDRGEPDRVEVAALRDGGVPHLIARAGYGRAELGPFVLPGATGCLTCADLARRDHDPAWPFIAFQLALMTPPAEPMLTDWLATGVLEQLDAWSRGRVPETAAASKRLDRSEGAVAWSAFPIHPSCPCAAATLHHRPA